MDPITTAAQDFMRQVERVWGVGRTRVLRMEASAQDRGDMIKTLRLMEWQPENRRPLFLYEAPFRERDPWFEGLCDKVREDYEAIREGAAEEGMALPPFDPGPHADQYEPIGRAGVYVDQAASLLRGKLEGILVAFAPEQIEDRMSWGRLMEEWIRASFPPDVRLALHDVPEGPLADILPPEVTARFQVDHDALMDYLKNLGAGSSAGPSENNPPPPPQPTPEQKAAIEEELGRKIPTPEAGKGLREALLTGAQKTGRRDYLGAVREYRAARDICHAEGLVAEEAIVLVALAGLSLAMEHRDYAKDAYRQAATLAEGVELWQVVSQSWIGYAGVLMIEKQHSTAARAYEQAAEAAEKGQIALLRLEALRLAGSCYLIDRDERGAARCWQQAVFEAEAVDAPAREASTVDHAAESLIKLLRKHGLTQQAAHVRTLLDQWKRES